MGFPEDHKMYKVLERSSSRILNKLKDLNVEFDFKILDPKSCIIVNVLDRKIALMTINALDEKRKEILAFGITVRKNRWEEQLKSSSEMELVGKLSNGPFKALPINKIVDFIS